MRISELFEDSDGRLSMSRFAVFCTLPMSAYALYDEPDRLDIILTAFVINYGVGKVADAFKGGSNDVANDKLEDSGSAPDSDAGSPPLPRRSKPLGKRKHRSY